VDGDVEIGNMCMTSLIEENIVGFEITAGQLDSSAMDNNWQLTGALSFSNVDSR
jgi:hypothetical protein